MVTKLELLNVCFGGKPDFDDTRIDEILQSVNIISTEYGEPMTPSCFYRSIEWDKSKGRTGNSQHCALAAVDFHDVDGSLGKWCVENQNVLERAGLWLENPQYTNGWCHLDRKQRKNRVFIP